MEITKTKLKNMTVGDVLATPEYLDNLTRLLDLIWKSRETARQKAILRNQRLIAHPIDRIHAAGHWQPQEFIKEYIAVIDKTSKYTAMARDYIREVGTTAYINTIKKVNEKKGNNRHRNNKQ